MDHLDCELDAREIEIDQPVARRPFAPEFAGQRTIAEFAQDAFEFGFGGGGFQPARIGFGVACLERRERTGLAAGFGHGVLALAAAGGHASWTKYYLFIQHYAIRCLRPGLNLIGTP